MKYACFGLFDPEKMNALSKNEKGRIERLDEKAEPDMRKEIGNAFIIEADNMEEAIEAAKKHPALGVAEGEDLGLSVEIHEIHTFEVKEG